MTRNYYYFISGLPDILVDESKNPPSFASFIDEVREQVAPADLKIIDAILLPVDNRNLVNMLEGKDGAFDPRGVYSKDTLAAGIRAPEDHFPEYMQTFVEAHKENRQLFPGLVAQDQLNWLFYEEMIEHSNDFVKEWFSFELNLRNVLTAITCRKGLAHIDALGTERDRPTGLTIIGRNDEAEMILRSSSPDFGLSSSLSWVERVLALTKGSLTDMEKGLDQLRWDILNDLTVFTSFQVETIAAFVVKLMMVERWIMLDPNTGRAKLDRLVEELRSSYTVPAGF